MKVCKDLLGVQKQTTNIGVLLELGKWPMSLNAKKICIKNWERIAVLKQASIVFKPSYEWAEENNMVWPFSVKKYFENIGLFELFLSNQSQNRTFLKTFCGEKDIFHQTGFYYMQLDSAELRTYSSIKTKIGMEHYLTNIHNITDQVSQTII